MGSVPGSRLRLRPRWRLWRVASGFKSLWHRPRLDACRRLSRFQALLASAPESAEGHPGPKALPGFSEADGSQVSAPFWQSGGPTKDLKSETCRAWHHVTGVGSVV
ncbi:unnamed protein product [Effrenium voratum]|uniref:Uncharacterized protein n=1 Tax=Effrenium voratum TaxID=2562239 RepID=A0AA36N0B5_9DINO|nr:unnamed protein product [Effrenium voratum]